MRKRALKAIDAGGGGGSCCCARLLFHFKETVVPSIAFCRLSFDKQCIVDDIFYRANSSLSKCAVEFVAYIPAVCRPLASAAWFIRWSLAGECTSINML